MWHNGISHDLGQVIGRGEQDRVKAVGKEDQELDDGAGYSADEGDDSDVDDSEDEDQALVGPFNNDAGDPDDKYVDVPEDQGGNDALLGGSIGPGEYDSFLLESLQPEHNPPSAPPSLSHSPDFATLKESIVENEKKRKFSDGLDLLSPDVGAAFLDNTGHFESGNDAGNLNTPDGPKQKRPRLRRPGQPLPKREEQHQTDEVKQPVDMSNLTRQTPAEHVPAASASSAAAKSSFLTSLLNDVDTKPQYPGGRF